MYLDGKNMATFKTYRDILKFKTIIDSWFQLNSNITEKIYTDGLQRMIPPYKHKPFVYDSTFNNEKLLNDENQNYYTTN